MYQSQAGQVRWLMIGYGLEYYLAQDLRPGTALPHQLFIERTAAQAGRLYPVPCPDPAGCLDLNALAPRIWIVGSGYLRDPDAALTRPQAALLRGRYRLTEVRHVPSLTVFLLVRT